MTFWGSYMSVDMVAAFKYPPFRVSLCLSMRLKVRKDPCSYDLPLPQQPHSAKGLIGKEPYMEVIGSPRKRMLAVVEGRCSGRGSTIPQHSKLFQTKSQAPKPHDLRSFESESPTI